MIAVKLSRTSWFSFAIAEKDWRLTKRIQRETKTKMKVWNMVLEYTMFFLSNTASNLNKFIVVFLICASRSESARGIAKLCTRANGKKTREETKI